jgi:apolipoprotein D and lipocalin family protein
MTAPLPPLPASLSRADGLPPGDLDARILQVEQRLIAREENLRRGVAAFSEQLGETLKPRRLLKPALIAAGVAALLLWRPSRAAAATVAAAPARASAAAGLHGLRGVPWVRLLGLAWPLVPAHWRHRISPGAASAIVAVGLPLVEALFGARRETPDPPLVTVAAVDLARLAGRWFLVGELPAALEAESHEPPELGLLPREDGQFDLLQRRIDGHGTHGRQSLVQPVAGSQGARLKVSAWPAPLQFLPWAWTEHGVLHVDEGYDEAVIGSTSRDSLWLLSRRPQLTAERRLALTQLARDRGFDIERLRFSEAP